MKRAFAFLLILVLVTMCFAACNKPAEPQPVDEQEPEAAVVAEIKDFGYTIKDNKINYAVCLKNIHENSVMPEGKYIARLTMFDKEGTEIDSCYIGTPELYPKAEVWTAGTHYFSVKNWESITDVKLNLYDLADTASHLSLKDAKHQVFTPLQATVINKNGKELSGEILNYNHYGIGRCCVQKCRRNSYRRL